MKKNFAIIGCGHIAHRHVKHISNHALGNVIGVFDIDETRLASFSKEKRVHAYPSMEVLLADERIDVVNICTPNGTHAELAIRVLESGKNVVVEKPMAIDIPSSVKMQETATRMGLKMFVVKQNRYNPPVKAVKKISC